jgi:hypothetical protein
MPALAKQQQIVTSIYGSRAGFNFQGDLVANGKIMQAGLGLDPGTTPASATLNTTIIQAALTAGGLVQITAPGTYIINATLTIYSDTRLILGKGVTIKMIDSAGGKPVLQNYAFTQRAAGATITLSWSSGTTAAITGWTAHGCEIGDYVWLQGATLDVYNVIGYLTAANSAAGTATVQLMYVPSGAVSGTIKALKADKNITIEGGLFDYNYPSNFLASSTLQSNVLNLGIIQNLNLLNVRSQNGQKYAFHTGAVRDMYAENCGAPINPSDLFKIFGPAINCKLVNTWGICGDDGVSVQPEVPSLFTAFIWTQGDILGVHVDGVDIHQTAGTAICGVYPNDTSRISDVKFSRIAGTTAGNAFAIQGEHSATDTVQDVTIEGMTAVCLVGIKMTQTGGGIIVDNIKATGLSPRFTTISGTAWSSNGSCTVRNGDFEVLIDDPAFGAAGAQYAFVPNGPYEFIRLRGSVKGGANGRFFAPIAAAANALGTAVLSFTQRTGDTPVVHNSGATGGVFIFEGCDTTTAAVINPAISCSLVFNNNRFHNTSNGVVRPTTTPTIDIRSSGNNKLTGTASFIVVPSGTPVLTVYGWDIAIDPIALTGLAGTVGQFCTSTQAGNESGMAVRGNVNGTPAWYALAGGALGVNAAIT